MRKYKGRAYVTLTLLAIFFLSPHYYGISVGDYLIQKIGVPPWIKLSETSRLHLSVLIGIIILIVGFICAVQYYKKTDPKITRKLLMACVIIALVTPLASEQLLYLFNSRAAGIHSVHYVKENSRCQYHSDVGGLQLDCSLMIVNFSGKQQRITVKPNWDSFPDSLWYSSRELGEKGEAEELFLGPRSKMVHTVQYCAPVGQGVLWGSIEAPDMIIEEE
ncbi:hypothetical protein [Paenibacillus sp. J2TS4]|uniref:hypothetical protein n=1 Tax=Paenibacillus sp. J2TS4 TaxID=2807194 RepID=UPI001B01E38F|nr:hypothetical protein [Paenibacillus sp. J2TS4]GIP33307.1 hypothetical protein J2TS4_25170 [Paenibacillus sp. J2TS4]